ncbi:hypothetical protein [Methanobrevibacter olleyae]|uniref:Uncharacterized protein n=1 Tax=Methanobrevibacter olleyae TaxID=294671 RepID=A0A126QZ21_METOL|nr:hypothetical protein [Methanobrevibacter olleyae]AMK15291.1 hypothetical protein YLM1_0734 [Methanobrevibacter olleyae]
MDSKNLIIICITAIICLGITVGAFILLNNGFDDSTLAVDNTTNDSISIKEVNSRDSSSMLSTPRLGSIENPKIGADYQSGIDGDINPNYGDYYVIDGGLFRDDNKYLGGAGTYTFISGKNPYDDTYSGSGDWYGKCTTHGWVKLDSNKHCPHCVAEGRDARVLKGSKYQK